MTNERYLFMRMFFTLAVSLAFVSCTGVRSNELEADLHRVPRVLVVKDSDGNPVESYCVVSLYGRSSGFGFALSESGVRKADPVSYLIWPSAENKEDKEITLRWKSEKYFYPFVFGESVDQRSFLILKNGFRPYLWNKYIDYRYGSKQVITLDRGDESGLFEDLISNHLDQESYRKLFKLRPDESVFYKLNQGDLSMLRKCYYR